MTALLNMDPALAVLDRFGHSSEYSFGALSNMTGVPKSTLHHRANGRVTIQQKSVDQQQLSPQEEKALVDYILRVTAWVSQQGSRVPGEPPKPPSVVSRTTLTEPGGTGQWREVLVRGKGKLASSGRGARGYIESSRPFFRRAEFSSFTN